MLRRLQLTKPTTRIITIANSTSSSSISSSPTRAFHSGGVRPGFDGPGWAQTDFKFESGYEGSLENRVAEGGTGFALMRRPGVGGSGVGGAAGLHDTSTGLAKEGVGQMSAEDVMTRIEAALQWYNPTTYAWLVLPSLDLIDSLVISNVVPKEHTHAHITRWFAAPEDVVHFPETLRDTLGRERLRVAEPYILKVFHDYETISPLNRVFAKYPELPRDIWTALCRWMAAMTATPDMKDTILSLTLAISNGLGPQSLCLPDLQQQRGTMVGHLLIAVGAEYGAVSLAQLGVDLLLINGTHCNFQDQKTLTVAFSRTSSRVMDWSVRSSGELLRCLPRWFKHHIAGNKDAGLVDLLAKQASSSAVSKSISSNNNKRQEEEDDDNDEVSENNSSEEQVEITGTDDMYTSEEAARQSEQLATMEVDGEEGGDSMIDEVDTGKKKISFKKSNKNDSKNSKLHPYPHHQSLSAMKGLADDDNSLDLGEGENELEMMKKQKEQQQQQQPIGFDEDFNTNEMYDHENDRESMMHGENEDDEPASAALIGNAPTSTYFATKKSQKEYYDKLHQNLLKQAVERKKVVSARQEETWAKLSLHRKKLKQREEEKTGHQPNVKKTITKRLLKKK